MEGQRSDAMEALKEVEAMAKQSLAQANAAIGAALASALKGVFSVIEGALRAACPACRNGRGTHVEIWL